MAFSFTFIFRYEALRSRSGVAGVATYMTAESLKEMNKRRLAQIAKEQGVAGWHAMRKDQLIRSLTAPRSGAKKPGPQLRLGVKPAARSRTDQARQRALAARRAPGSGGGSPSPARIVTIQTLDHGCVKDRIIVLTRDSYWLHAYWELSRTTLARAQAALGQDWHGARPILRVLDVTSEDTTSAAERHVRDIAIHGGVNNWYIDVVNPPRSYRVDIGYLSRKGKFYVLARSNLATTPKVGASDALDEKWANVQRQFDRVQNPSSQGGCAGENGAPIDIRDLLEERLARPSSAPSLRSLSTGALGVLGESFHFQIDAELIVHGSTKPNAKVTLQGEHVQLRTDGTFTVRFGLPDSRQIIPAVASSADGIEERTIVLAIERNTKELEPMIHDCNEA